jgi:cyanophycin synthetase
MRVLEHRALRGPNRYSRHPAIFMLLDIGDFEETPSDTLPGFTERLIELVPSLQAHRCSVGTPGGFIQRLYRGTWVGHIVEHITLELQCLAGMEVGFGKTYDTSQYGIYKVVYRYRVESAGLFAGLAAVDLVEAVIADRPCDLDASIAQLKDLREKDMLGPSTGSIVEEARRRGIPTQRLNDENLIQLGYGAKQRRIQATMTDRTSALGVEIADEKFRTKRLLAQNGIPTPAGSVQTSLEEAVGFADEIGYPVAVKPDVGNHGRGITSRVSNPLELESAFASAAAICASVIVEKSLNGHDFRALVIDGKLVAAARREPAHVIGDGSSSIGELIEMINSDPRRGMGHERVLTRINVDSMTERLLSQGGFAMFDVLPGGQRLNLKSTANLSTGGTATDVTEEVHEDVRLMCERISRLVGMDCLGIDIVATSLDLPLDPHSSGVVEVNAAPGFRMHLEPTEGRPRDVAAPFVEMLFPSDQNHEVPIVAVTGTNGKTTTSRLISHALKYEGKTVGFAGTTGVEIDGVEILSGDYSGPDGAAVVLREPTIDHAVLEVARGGIVRRGLGFDDCDIGVLLNVGEDHIGNDGVEDVDELALVKATVIEAVRENGVSVLNADDPIVVGLRDLARGEIIYFSLDPTNETVVAHLESGGVAVLVDRGEVVIRSPMPPIHVLPVVDAPITLRGVATFNVANVLAAVAALHGLGTPVDKIRTGISTFHSSATQNPGRMNMIDFVTFKVIVDYGHNVPAVRAMGNALPHLTSGRKIVVAHGTGNRLDESIRSFGSALAEVYDYIILAEVDPRNRVDGESPALVRSGAVERGHPEANIEIVMDELKAIDRAFEIVRPGDLIVVQVDQVTPMLDHIMQHFAQISQVSSGGVHSALDPSLTSPED